MTEGIVLGSLELEPEPEHGIGSHRVHSVVIASETRADIGVVVYFFSQVMP